MICDCTGTNQLSGPYHGAFSVCNDYRLGPKTLPWRFPLLSLVSNYDRFGGLTPGAFLDRWWGNTSYGIGWRYPEHDGFLLDTDGRPMISNFTLQVNARVDRFGDESGHYMGAADAPFAQRALPPDALNVCKPKKVTASEAELLAADEQCQPKAYPWGYHVYNVTRQFNVSAGPIAPAFGQPGLGVQFRLPNGTRVRNLTADGTLVPLNLSTLHNGPTETTECGRNPINCDCQRPHSIGEHTEL